MLNVKYIAVPPLVRLSERGNVAAGNLDLPSDKRISLNLEMIDNKL